MYNYILFPLFAQEQRDSVSEILQNVSWFLNVPTFEIDKIIKWCWIFFPTLSNFRFKLTLK